MAFCRLVPSIAMLASILLVTCGPLAADDNQRDELVETVIAGIKQNYSRLETVQLTLHVATKHPKILVEEKETFRRDDDTVVTIIRSPETSEVRKCVLRGKDLRVESAGDHCAETIVTYHKGLWTKYVPASKVARISLPENVGESLPPVDPRDIGILGARRSLTEKLRQDSIMGVEQVDSADGTMLIRIELEDSKGRRWFIDSDPSRGFLPKAITYVRANGNVAATTEFTYQEAIEGAWFLKEAVQRLFDVETEDCLTVMTARVRDLVVNQNVDEDVFRIELPAGVRVYDDSDPEIFKRRRGQAGDSELRARSWRIPLVVVSCLGVLGILFVHFRYHRYKRRTVR